MHKTLSFLCGTGVAYIGYLTISDGLILRNNRTANQLLSGVRNRQFVEDLPILPESKDYVQITKKTCCSWWNRSILYMHSVLTRWLHYNKPYDEKIEDIIQSHKRGTKAERENLPSAEEAMHEDDPNSKAEEERRDEEE